MVQVWSGRRQVISLGLLTAAVCWVGLSVAASPLRPGDQGASGPVLTVEQRIAAQRAIEQVYWRHRLAPGGTAGSRPAFVETAPDAALRAKVLDYLAQSRALEAVWGRPVTPAELRAEVDRMARSTRAPGVLRELFAALGNDPLLIAECLARPLLVNRRARWSYDQDWRFHGEAEAAARNALAGRPTASQLRQLGAVYAEEIWEKETAGEQSPRCDGARLAPAEDWPQLVEGLARRFGVAASATRASADSPVVDELPLHSLSALHEDEEGFSVTMVLEQSATRITLATATWPKRPFDDWWLAVKGQHLDGPLPAELTAATAPASLPLLDDSPCTEDTWSTLFGGVPDPGGGGAGVWTGSEMIVWGGSGGGAVSTGFRYDPATDTWTRMSVVGAPEGRYGTTLIWTGTEAIVWGGGTRGLIFNSGSRYDPVTDTWRPMSIGENTPAARYLHTAIWTGSEMIVWGGSTNSSFLNTGGRYDPATDTWRPTSTGENTPAERYRHTAIWSGSAMIVWGGDTGSSANTGARYDPSSDLWTPTSIDGAPAARWDHIAVWTGAEMVVWGGSAWPAYLNTGGRYDPATDTWRPTSTGADVPTPRYDMAGVWTGSEMIVWGGAVNVQYAPGKWRTDRFNTGGRYDPVTDTWRPTSTGANVPTPRGGMAGVWTGSEMIVWGGSGGSGSLITGGRYDPAADAWSPTHADSDAPEARYWHMAVWSGAELIVWGGVGGRVLRSGGRYDPATDSWTPTPLTGAPEPMWRATSVWSGKEMIVFGAARFGGRYDPVVNAWRPTAAAPSGRAAPTGIWTGSEMIVWGSGLVSTGLRYNPAQDVWTETSPAPRNLAYHRAVWTGSEMIVWGGHNELGELFRTGLRYNPSADAWAETSPGPEGRDVASAVWTGSEMIVWGGSQGCYG